MNREWAPVDAFRSLEMVNVHPMEVSGAFPRTREILERRGLDVRTVDLSELAKAEGAATCCSVIFKQQTAVSAQLSAADR